MEPLLWFVAALLALFSASAVVLLVREMRRLRSLSPRSRDRSIRRRFAEYVGPVDRKDAPATPAWRVAAEFFSAMLGFPGLGWMVSGRITVGLPLIVAVPAALWLFYPLYIAVTGTLVRDPVRLLWVLPVLAFTSAGSLASAETRGRRHA